MTRRARIPTLLGVSLACGGLAASMVNGYAGDVRAQVGPLVPVVVARAPIPRGHVFRAAHVANHLAQRRVPARFAPPDGLRNPREALGLRTATAIAPGGYVGRSQLAAPVARRSTPTVSSAGRVVEVAVAGMDSVGALARPGSLVDVLVTSNARTYIALQAIELLGLRAGESADVSGGSGSRVSGTVATLRVSLRQAVLLVAAQNFARELRLVPRAAGDRRRILSVSTSAGDLRP